MIIASHDMHIVRDTCNRAFVLNAGEITEYNKIEEAISAYNSM
jgi:ABC-type polysaccharide/polyol phosphate transport system ATPase subunit